MSDTLNEVASFLESQKIDPVAVKALVSNTTSEETRGRAELEALWMRDEKAGKPKRVVSYRFRNLIINWHKAVTDILISAVELATHHDKIGRVMAIVHGVAGLVSAAGIEVGRNEAEIVFALWQDQKDESRVSRSWLSDKLSMADDDFARALQNLDVLGIIEIDDPEWIVKVDKIYVVM